VKKGFSRNLRCGGGKAVYDSFPTARRMAEHANAKDRRTGRTTRKVTAYHCTEHNGWHITSHTPKKQELTHD
jgi:hypothetical protein